MKSTNAHILVLALALPLAAGACQPRTEPGEGGTTETEGVVAPEVESEPGSNVVAVVLTNYEIDMPATIPAGPTTLRIEHRGGFAIEGETVATELESRLRPGESTTFELDLPPGPYFVFCPVDNHQGFGMEHELTVVEPELSPDGPTSS